MQVPMHPEEQCPWCEAAKYVSHTPLQLVACLAQHERAKPAVDALTKAAHRAKNELKESLEADNGYSFFDKEVTEPTDDELLKIYCNAEGDGSSYSGWLALYRAGKRAERKRLYKVIDSTGVADDWVLDILRTEEE